MGDRGPPGAETLDKPKPRMPNTISGRVVLKETGDDLCDEFVMGEFLDRFGVRLSQLGNILSQIGPLADAAPPDGQ